MPDLGFFRFRNDLQAVWVGDVDDDLRSALEGMTPKSRDLLRRVIGDPIDLGCLPKSRPTSGGERRGLPHRAWFGVGSLWVISIVCALAILLLCSVAPLSAKGNVDRLTMDSMRLW